MSAAHIVTLECPVCHKQMDLAERLEAAKAWENREQGTMVPLWAEWLHTTLRCADPSCSGAWVLQISEGVVDASLQIDMASARTSELPAGAGASDPSRNDLFTICPGCCQEVHSEKDALLAKDHKGDRSLVHNNPSCINMAGYHGHLIVAMDEATTE